MRKAKVKAMQVSGSMQKQHQRGVTPEKKSGSKQTPVKRAQSETKKQLLEMTGEHLPHYERLFQLMEKYWRDKNGIKGKLAEMQK